MTSTHLVQQPGAKFLRTVLDDRRGRSKVNFPVASFALGWNEMVGHALSPRQAVQFPEKLAALQQFQVRTLVCESQHGGTSLRGIIFLEHLECSSAQKTKPS